MSTKVNISSAETSVSTDISAQPLFPGKGYKLGEYIIIDLLGHGAMASVYLARDTTGHEVALKIFQEGPGVSSTMLERFRREAEASKKLRRHPHIMTIYATGKDGPYHYIVMQSIRNSKTLEDALENTPMSVSAIILVVIKIARALQYAHKHHIVHRDVKPTNIMIDEFGEPLLSDFGVASLIDWPSCTMTGALTGTPLYMSPEQARGERVGPASDIYSLGVVLFEALTSVLPYTTQHCSPVKDVLEAVKNEEPRRPRLFRKEISPDLEAVILKTLEKTPKNRYADAEAFATDLERVLAGRRVSAHRFSPLDHFRHLLRRHQQLLIALAIVLAFAAGIGLFFREKLMTARYESLLRLAQLKQAEFLLTHTDNAGTASQTPTAWNEVRLARKAMAAGNWDSAAAGFQAAGELSDEVRDTRTKAIAQLDQARCEIMLNNRLNAKRIYHDILTNPDASATIASFAQLEYLALALLEKDTNTAVNVLVLREPPADGPVRDAINCLGGATPPDDLLGKIDGMPLRFQNDAYLAAGLRFNLNGDSKRCAAYLKRTIQVSIPPSEWPAPFAKLLYADLMR